MMFGDIRRFVTENGTLDTDRWGEPAGRDLVVAIVVLLLEVAHRDHDFAASEVTDMVSSLNRHFKMTDEQAGEILEVADFLRRDGSKIAEIIEKINNRFDDQQKVNVLALIWKVALADGIADKHEIRFSTEIRQALHLSLEEALRARKIAEDGAI